MGAVRYGDVLHEHSEELCQLPAQNTSNEQTMKFLCLPLIRSIVCRQVVRIPVRWNRYTEHFEHNQTRPIIDICSPLACFAFESSPQSVADVL